MSKQTLLERLLNIKQKFDDMLPTAYKLADGTEVTISLLDIGGDFMIGGMPAPEGGYTLSDGTGVTVDSTGKITAITEPAGDNFAATEYTLAGGDKVSIDKLEVGGVVTKGGVTVSEGNWSLDDGTTLSTDSNGVITVLVKPASPSTEAGAAMTKEKVQQAYDDITGAAPTDQLGKLTICVKALMEYAFGWQLDGSPEENAKAAEVAQSTADALNVYNQGLAAQTAKFTAQEKSIAKFEKELSDTRETLKQALELMTQLAESPSLKEVPIERKVIFTGDAQKSKKAGIARFVKAAEKLYENEQNLNK